MQFSDASSPYRFPDPLPHAGIFRMSRTESRHPMSEVCRPLPAGRTNRAWPSRLDRPRCSAAPSCASERARRRPRRPALGACRRAIGSDLRAAGTVEGAGHDGATGPPSGRPAWCSTHAVYHDRDRGSPAQILARIPGRHRRPDIPREPIAASPGRCAHNAKPARSPRADSSSRSQHQTVHVTSLPAERLIEQGRAAHCCRPRNTSRPAPGPRRTAAFSPHGPRRPRTSGDQNRLGPAATRSAMLVIARSPMRIG